ncbi:MAG: coenzyme F420 hydrogenase [Thermoproteota archaeon]|nr:MAG: coenzyme F420 hydrogenase [Candidatus Korarchaeota archaeon]RLG50113.1 MAG: coenzyme F420 hydrogenase [Candidatus Korarchaeota archaeon]
MKGKKILIAGIGDLLRSDDGFGPRVVSKLENMNLPKNVVVKDYGTSGLDLIFDLGDFDEVIFVDAIDFEGNVGEIKVIEPKPRKIAENEVVKTINFSLHEIDLEKIIELASSLNILPKRVMIIGCKPKDLSLGLKLSEEVERAIGRTIEIILEKIREG